MMVLDSIKILLWRVYRDICPSDYRTFSNSGFDHWGLEYIHDYEYENRETNREYF